MKTYKYFLDNKITIWERTHFSIEAKTKKEALAKAKEFLKDENECPEDIWVETLYESSERMSVEENEGNATRELFDEKGNEIANNAKQ